MLSTWVRDLERHDPEAIIITSGVVAFLSFAVIGAFAHQLTPLSIIESAGIEYESGARLLFASSVVALSSTGALLCSLMFGKEAVIEHVAGTWLALSLVLMFAMFGVVSREYVITSLFIAFFLALAMVGANLVSSEALFRSNPTDSRLWWGFALALPVIGILFGIADRILRVREESSAFGR